jgi:amino acid adenylation domain-containing protein
MTNIMFRNSLYLQYNIKYFMFKRNFTMKMEASIYQKKFYFEWLFDPKSSAYNTHLAFDIKGSLNIPMLKQALTDFVNDHENQRTYFIEDSGQLKQVIVDKLEVSLEYYDLFKKPSKDPRGDAKKIRDEVCNHAFDLNKLPIFRFALIRLEEDLYTLVVNWHHILTDGSFAEYFNSYLSSKYNSLVSGGDFDWMPEVKIKDYLENEKETLNDQLYKNSLDYWLDLLNDELPHVKFNSSVTGVDNLDFPNRKTIIPKTKFFSLNEKVTSSLKCFSRSCKSTPFIFLSSVFTFILSDYTDQKDMYLAYSVDIRPPGFKNLLGCFTNVLLMHIECKPDLSVLEYIDQVRQQRKKSKIHQKVPISEIITSLMKKDKFDSHLLCNVGITETKLGLQGLSFIGCDVKSIKRGLEHLNDINLYYEIGDVVTLGLAYNGNVFADNVIDSLVKRFETCIVEFYNSQDKILKEIVFFDKDLHKKLLSFGVYLEKSINKNSIVQLFEEQVKKAPDNIALVFEDQKLSYKDLNKKSNQLAHLIRAKYKKQNKKDLTPDSLIGLCVERSLDMIIGILGILKAGGAYVPLDPDYPQDRLEYMIEDSHEGLIITQKGILGRDGFLNRLHHEVLKYPDDLLIIDSDEVKAELSIQSDANLDKISGPDNLAYVIYTSGSTGRPKGVMVENNSVCNFITHYQRCYNITEKDRFSQVATVCFDAFGCEMWPALCSGASLHICLKNTLLNSEEFLKWLVFNKITICDLSTRLGELLFENNYREGLCLRHVKVGGEKLTRLPKSFWGCVITNTYGPTETTIEALDCKVYDKGKVLFPKVDNIPIGKSLLNYDIYVLDRNLNPCPIGTPGELYIGGTGLARGYLNQEELTKERFISNPFAKELGLESTDRIYKTGDLVRWLPDGNIEYLGRTDFQVKIRGFRIELGEIESVLSKNQSISRAVVIDKEKEGQKYLVAYYVIVKDKKDLEIDDLRDYLSETLPDYMVPAAFVKMDRMPLTPNGKINRRALPEPDMSLMGEEYVAPRNEIEQKLADIWSDILKIDKDKVGIHDNFFSMGGHSLLTMQLVGRINNAFDLKASVVWVFENQSIAVQAESLGGDISSLLTFKPVSTFNAGESRRVPLFLIHPSGGGAEYYASMKHLLDPDQPLYGVESYNLNHLDDPETDLKELAKKYVEFIKEVVPTGPYCLGGWSLGGTLAQEVAHQFIESGEPVLGLYLIDTLLVQPEQWKALADGISSYDDIHVNRLKNLGASAEDIYSILKLIPLDQKLLQGYSLGNLPKVDTILMQALKLFDRNNLYGDLDESSQQVLQDSVNLQSKYCSEQKYLHIAEFDADHYSIMQGENLVKVAKIIQADIDRKIKKKKK